jgi:hypothetical protein
LELTAKVRSELVMEAVRVRIFPLFDDLVVGHTEDAATHGIGLPAGVHQGQPFAETAFSWGFH